MKRISVQGEGIGGDDRRRELFTAEIAETADVLCNESRGVRAQRARRPAGWSQAILCGSRLFQLIPER